MRKGREIEGARYSAFDEMYLVRLPNWGRWGRHDPDRPDADRLGSPLADRMKDDETEHDYDAVPEDLILPINSRDAELLDEHICRIYWEHRHIIIKHFYKRQPQPRARLDAAIRSLLDAISVRWVA